MGLLDTPGVPGSDWYKYMKDPRSINMGPLSSTKKVKGAGLFDRLGQTLLPDPSNAGGLFSPEDIAHARSQGLLGIGQGLLAASGPTDMAHKVGFMQAVGAGLQGGQDAYQGALSTAAAYKKTAQDMQTGQLGNQAKQLELDQATKRQKILAALPPPDQSAGSGAMLKWIDQAVPALTQAGLTDDATSLAGMRKSLEREKYQFVQGRDAIYRGDPNTGDLTKLVDLGMNPDAMQEKALDRQVKLSQIAATRTMTEESHAQSAARAFTGRNQKLVDTSLPYSQAKSAFAEARAGNPAALKSAIVSFAGVADPKAQLRQGIIEMLSKLDPSIHGEWALAQARLEKGQLPPYVINDMEKLVDRIHGQNKALYQQRYNAETKRHPNSWIPTPEEQFDLPGGAPDAAPSGGGSTDTTDLKKKYGLE